MTWYICNGPSHRVKLVFEHNISRGLGNRETFPPKCPDCQSSKHIKQYR